MDIIIIIINCVLIPIIFENDTFEIYRNNIEIKNNIDEKKIFFIIEENIKSIKKPIIFIFIFNL